MTCPNCQTERKPRNLGFRKQKTGRRKRYECRNCHKTFMDRNIKFKGSRYKDNILEYIEELLKVKPKTINKYDRYKDREYLTTKELQIRIKNKFKIEIGEKVLLDMRYRFTNESVDLTQAQKEWNRGQA